MNSPKTSHSFAAGLPARHDALVQNSRVPRHLTPKCEPKFLMRKGIVEPQLGPIVMSQAQCETKFLKPVRAHQVKEKCQATQVAFSSDGLNLAIAYSSSGTHKCSNKVLVWNLPGWRKVKTFRGCTETVDDLAFSPDGASLVCAGTSKQRFMGGEVSVWCTRTWKKRLTIDGNGVESIRRIAIMPQGKYFATGSACYDMSGTSKKVRLWNAVDGQLLKKFAEFQEDITGLQFSPDGKSLAVGVAGNRTASIWTIPSGRKRWLQRAHTDAMNLRVVFSPTGKLLATCGDKNVALWDTKSGKSYAILKGHENHVNAVAFSDDGLTLFSTAWKELRVWDVASGRLIASQPLPHLNLVGIKLSAEDSKFVGVHSINDELRIVQFDVRHLLKEVEPTPAFETKIPRSDREKELIAAVIADPDKDPPRLKYADWLDDLGDPRGEFIRVQCELATFEPRHMLNTQQKRRRTRLVKQSEKLLQKHFAAWTTPLIDLKLRPGQAEFRRGFLWGLELQDIDVTDDSLKVLRHAPELERLNLDGSGVTDDGMQYLKAVKNLREIVVSETKVTVDSLTQLRELPRLIRVYNYEWGNRKIEELEKLKQARNRRFLKLPKGRQRAEALRALPFIVDGFPANKQQTHTNISYSQSWASDADLVYLRAIPEVESLDFFECRAVTSKGLEHLRSLKHIRTLCLAESGVTDLAPLRHLNSIEVLTLDSLEALDARSFRHLIALKNLKSLTVRFCGLGDEILKHIGQCSELRQLDLIFNRFSGQGLRNLLNLTKLEKLEIDDMEKHQDLLAEVLGKPLPKRRRRS